MNPRRFVTRLPLIALAVCVGLCLSALGGPSGPQRAQAQESRPLQPVAVGELQRESTHWMGRRVRFTFQFQSAPDDWNPYMTRFGTRDYAAAIGWGDDQILWRSEDFAAPSVLLFARRGTPAAELLAEGQTYARYEVVGRVGQVFLGLPWIEIEQLTRLPEETGEGAILHVSRALRSMESGDWTRALEDIARAEVSNLPAAAREELARLRTRCEDARAARKLPLRR